jgi:hypothetical protein
MLRTHIGKSSRLFISILVTQDHIESIGNPIQIKADEVLHNGLLAQMLSDIAPNPTSTFSFQICHNPNLQLGPTDSFYLEPPSSYDIATTRNPNSSVSPIRVSVSPRWPHWYSEVLYTRFLTPFRDDIWNRRQVSVGDRGVLPTLPRNRQG